MAELKLKKINKIYDNGVQAVFDFNMEIKNKEFIVFVGPSGCGKSTTLRMIAGLEEITSGELYIDDKLMNDVPPKDRNIAMVFQSYALYPHMSVYDNMAFSLKLRKVPKNEIEKRVKEVSSILGLDQYLNRKPRALSGGQRQRVALGRAIVRNPKVFLMDEPLSNLDAKLRVQMRSEIIKIHKRVDATTIYVTHDQVEAMTMADRIVVMKDGYIQQIGAPKELYNRPYNKFVAGFIGAPAMNFIEGEIANGRFIADGKEKLSFAVPAEVAPKLKDYEGKKILMGIRPENIELINTAPANDGEVKVVADVVELLGDVLNVHGYIGETKFVVKTDSRYDIRMQDEVVVKFDTRYVHFFDIDTELAIR
jgi:multiple sugar transport system ATP-binding protein